MYYYRFRSARALLEKFQELERQEIYFSHPQELNDPLEGFKNIVWRGDPIVWANVLRHYVLCLMQTVTVALIAGPDHKVTPEQSFVFFTDDTLPTPKLKETYRRICDAFFQHEDITVLPGLLSQLRPAVRRNELTSYLRAVHCHALNAVLTIFEDSNRIPPRAADDPIREFSRRRIRLKDMLEALHRAEQEHPQETGIAEVLSESIDVAYVQTDLINEYNGLSSKLSPAWRMIISDFPSLHISQLERLLYKDWYTACFVQDPRQAAMWGNYADSHTGVCLKFRAHPNTAGKPALRLRTITGCQVDKDGIAPVTADVLHELHPVKYSRKFVEIDFFRSMGAVTAPMLRQWFKDASGKASALLDATVGRSEERRKRYWDSFTTSMTTKLADWAHETEYRCVLYSNLTDLADRCSRKLRFQFADLQGIIFGMKTSTADKLAIIRLIEHKCRAEGRKEFEFHQAYYSSSTGSMATHELRLIEFS